MILIINVLMFFFGFGLAKFLSVVFKKTLIGPKSLGLLFVIATGIVFWAKAELTIDKNQDSLSKLAAFEKGRIEGRIRGEAWVPSVMVIAVVGLVGVVRRKKSGEVIP